VATDPDPTFPTDAEAPPLDDQAPPLDAEAPSRDDGAPLGVRAQLGAVIAAARRLVSAHVGLARAEGGEIMGEVGRVVLLGCIAIAVLLLVGLLFPIGLLLFLGEWIFGSIGWGVLLGSLLLIDIAVFALLLAVRVPTSRLARPGLIALLVGVALGVLAGIALGPRVGVALGVLAALIAWPALSGLDASRAGIDTEALKARFYPSQTIETTKETIEWVRQQTPLGRKS
jgi:hypothetical protein